MGAATRPPARSTAREIAEHTDVGEVYLKSLVRTQFRLALTVVGVMAVVLGSLPLIFASSDDLAAASWFGIPLPWLVLGVAVYPALTAAAIWIVRSATRAERDFLDLVNRR